MSVVWFGIVSVGFMPSTEVDKELKGGSYTGKDPLNQLFTIILDEMRSTEHDSIGAT